MSMLDSFILFVSTSFWGWVVVIISIFIKAAKAKLDNSCNLHNDYALFPGAIVKTGTSLYPKTDKAFHGQSYTRFLGYDSTIKRADPIPMVTLLLSEESAVFEAHLYDPQRRLTSQKFH
jgi:hypothetical protein